MQFETVNLANNKLTGEWHHANSRKQLIVICHGFQSSSNNPALVGITNGLNKLGYDTLTFDFTENMAGFDIEHQVNDIVQIAKYFGNYDALILVAHSFAALTAAIATPQVPKIKGLITLNGFFGQSALGQEHRKNYLKFRVAALVIPKYRKILKYFKQELQPKYIKVPVLIIHSVVDKYVFIKQSQDFYKQLTVPKHFVELEYAKHGLTESLDRKKVVTEIHKWLKTNQKF
jgi:alpha-beta hydrolase superfamily lysophospholipase